MIIARAPSTGRPKTPNVSAEGVRCSFGYCIKVLGGRKKIHSCECDEVDPKAPVETSNGEKVEQGKACKVNSLNLSEARAETIRSAAMVHANARVEIRISL